MLVLANTNPIHHTNCIPKIRASKKGKLLYSTHKTKEFEQFDEYISLQFAPGEIKIFELLKNATFYEVAFF